MSKEIVSANSTAVTLSQKLNLSDSQMDLVRRTICKNATDDEIEKFFYQCSELKLNPLMPGRIYLLKFENKKQGGWYPANIIIGVDGFRSLAARTGQLAGIKRGVIRDKNGSCVGAYADVFRKDWTHPAHVEVSIGEYRDPYKDIWKTKPETMIQKVAEVHALRMAFPDDLGGVYSDDEMPTPTEKEVIAEPLKALEPKTIIAPVSSPSRETLNRALMEMYRPFMTLFPNTEMASLLQKRYQVPETRLMTVQQLEDLVEYMKEKMKSAQKSQENVADVPQSEERKVSPAQITRLFVIAGKCSVTDAQVKAYVLSRFGKQSRTDLSLPEYDQLIDIIQAEGLPPVQNPAPVAPTEAAVGKEKGGVNPNKVPSGDLPWNKYLEDQPTMLK